MPPNKGKRLNCLFRCTTRPIIIFIFILTMPITKNKIHNKKRKRTKQSDRFNGPIITHQRQLNAEALYALLNFDEIE